jgi:ribonuclease P protein component
VLPARFRLRRAGDFTATVKGGSRAARPHLVVHLVLVDPAAAGSIAAIPARAGFVVSKAVGGSVTRHAVVRRLRPLVATRLTALPAGTRVVIRALPAAAEATSQSLDRDLDSALAKALSRELSRTGATA